jgi:hypothetical protein
MIDTEDIKNYYNRKDTYRTHLTSFHSNRILLNFQSPQIHKQEVIQKKITFFNMIR